MLSLETQGRRPERPRPIVAKARQRFAARDRIGGSVDTVPRWRTRIENAHVSTTGHQQQRRDAARPRAPDRSGTATTCDHWRRHSTKRSVPARELVEAVREHREPAMRVRPARRAVDHRPIAERPVGEVRIGEPDLARAGSRGHARRRRAAASRNSARDVDGHDVVGRSCRLLQVSVVRHRSQPARSHSRQRSACGARASELSRPAGARSASRRMQRRIAAAGAASLAVDEDVPVVVQHARAAVEAHAASGRCGDSRAVEPDAAASARSAPRRAPRDALRDRPASGARAPSANARSARECAPAGASARLRPRSRVARPRHRRRRGRVGDALQHVARQRVAAGARKPMEAVMHSPIGHAVVAPARRQVQHVARLEQPIVGRRRSRPRIFSGTSARKRASRRAADAPAPPALRPAAGRRRSESTCGPTPPPSLAKEHHQVVEPRIGHEAETRRAGRAPRHVQVDPLHQQRPARRAQRRAARAAATARGAATSGRRRARRGATRHPRSPPARTARRGRAASTRRTPPARAAAASASAGA